MFLSRSWRVFLPWLIGIVGSLIFLAVGEKPWADGLDTTKAVKESIRTHSWAVIGLWWGAALNVLIGSMVVMFLFLRRNHQPKRSSSLGIPNESSLSKRERFGYSAAVFAMAVLGAVMMFPRLNLSLWGDEQATTYRYIVGNVYRVGENQDEFVLKAPHWKKTLFNWDSGPSNQVMFSVLARLVHGPGNISGDDPGEYYFTEWKIRVPSFLAGIGAILSTCWLVWLLGARRGAWLAGFLMAMHPLILRYSTEARGYSLLLLFGPLVVCFLIQALQTTRLRWWIPFGITQFFLLWSYFGSVYLLVPLNAVAIWLAWDFGKNRNPLNSGQLWRYAGATILGAMLTIQIMLPNLLQLSGFLETGRLTGSIDGKWVQDSISFWVSGMPWHEWDSGNPNSVTLSETYQRNAFGVIVLLGTILIISVFTIIFAKNNKHFRSFVPILLFPALLMAVHSYVSGNLLYPWYTVGFIPFGIIWIAVGYSQLSASREKKRVAQLGRGLVGGMFFIPVIFLVDSHRDYIRHNSIEPLGESTRHYREVVNPFHPEIDSVKSISFHHYSRLYDPAGLVVKSDEEFIALLEELDAEGTPIWVNTAHIPFGKLFYPKAFEMLENTEIFEKPVVFWGMQPVCTRSVFRYKSGGLARRKAGSG